MNTRSIAACALALTFLAVSGRIALAQDRSQDNRGQYNGGQGNRPGMNNQDRGHSFNDNDRQVTRDWYRQHQRSLGAGWRQRDRLSPRMQGRLRRGQRLDPQLRRQMHWLPSDLSRRYGPAPRGYRYAIIGGNIVVLDAGYNVWDVFGLDFSIR